MQRHTVQLPTVQRPRGQTRAHPTLALLALLGAEAGAAVVLAGMRSWVPGPTELLHADVEPALHGAAWVLAVGLVGWLTVTTVAAITVRALRIRVALPAVDRITLPAIRRLAERATALSLVASSFAGLSAALASEPPPIPVVVVAETAATAVLEPSTATSTAGSPVDVSPVPLISRAFLPSSPAPTATASAGFPSTFGAPIPAIDLTSDASAELHRHVVSPGDSMWTITVRHLSEQLGVEPSNGQISEVWRVVMDLNRHSIRSGDVDLIFPGEELLLPNVSA